MPITFSVLTNMVAFMPMFFVPGFMGKVFRQIPVVVISVFAVSLIESLFILAGPSGPSEAVRRPWGSLGWLHRQQQRFSRTFIRFCLPGLPAISRIDAEVALCHRGDRSGGAAGHGRLYAQSGRMGFELFPKVESDYAKVTATLPFGAAFERTLKVQQRLVAAARQVAQAERRRKTGGRHLRKHSSKPPGAGLPNPPESDGPCQPRQSPTSGARRSA